MQSLWNDFHLSRRSLDTAYLKFTVDLPAGLREPAIAWLAELPYEAFEETASGVEAYIPAHAYHEAETLEALRALNYPLAWRAELVARENWNQKWENAYQPVRIAPWFQVLATFHDPEPGYQYTLRIQPQMSFGTGHHETTRLMMRLMAELNFGGARVIDMGCGAGILAILAAQMGAAQVIAIDNDPWCVENTAENAALNGRLPVEPLLGDASVLATQAPVSIFLANINLHILRTDLPAYVHRLLPGGSLVISGFFSENTPELVGLASGLGLSLQREAAEGPWAALLFQYEKVQNL